MTGAYSVASLLERAQTSEDVGEGLLERAVGLDDLRDDDVALFLLVDDGNEAVDHVLRRQVRREHQLAHLQKDSQPNELTLLNDGRRTLATGSVFASPA